MNYKKNSKNAISFRRALNTTYAMYFMLKTKVSQGLEVHFTLDLHTFDIILIQIKLFFICYLCKIILKIAFNFQKLHLPLNLSN